MLRSLGERIRRRLNFVDVHSHIATVRAELQQLEHRMRYLQEAVGRVEARQTREVRGGSVRDREFRVYSQWGEDGIIQYLVQHVPIDRKIFVEFGVESYEEANTRFLLINDNWSGLVLDADSDHVQRIKQSPEYWLYNLKAVESFVTRENINQLLEANGVTGQIGLLSIDIDGMDYWLWDAIDVIDPAIVVIEYNYRFGIENAVTVPYDPHFDRRSAHPSILYYGASLKALCSLAERKGYALVGVGSAGLNAFFVKRDRLPEELPELSPDDAFVEGQFCEAHDDQGRRIYMTNEEERRLVRSLPLVDVEARPEHANESERWS